MDELTNQTDSSIRSFDKHVLTIYYMPGNVLPVKQITVEEKQTTDTEPAFIEL